MRFRNRSRRTGAVNKKYRLLATDIDGTLITDDMDITSETFRAVREAVENGLVIAPASGRGPGPLKKVTDRFDLELPLVCFNGAMIINGKTDEIIHTCAMDRQDAVDIYLKGKEMGVGMEVWTVDNELGYDSWNEFTEFYQLNSAKERDEIIIIGDDLSIFEKPIMKVLWHDHPERITELIPWGEKYIKDTGRNMVCATSQDFLLEYTHKNATKAMGIKHLCDHYGIDHSLTIAIGDGLNDKSMIEYAALGVAMKNAHPDVIRASDFVAPSNEEDGVAYIIDRFMLGKDI